MVIPSSTIITAATPPIHVDLVERTEEFVKKYMEQYKDSSHDWSHVERVRKMALKLAEKEGAMNSAINIDKQIVELAALLHDVGDSKFLPHGEKGEKVLSNTMDMLNYPERFKEAISWIVPRISFRHELEHPKDQFGAYQNELCCVQDADRLEAIGAIGVARCFSYNGARNLPLYDRELQPEINLTAEHYNGQLKSNSKVGNARNHFYEKLLKIAGLLKTTSGKEEAKTRHALIASFIKQFDYECDLADPFLSISH